MRIYQSNGDCENKPEDVNFGWWLCDIEEGDANIQIQKCHKETEDAYKKPRIIMESVESLSDLADLACQAKGKPLIIIKHEPEIKMYPVQSVEESPLLPEGVLCDNKLVSIVQPTNQQITSLINTSTLEGKLLLSVIHYAKYASLLKELKIDEFSDCKNVLSFMFEWALAETAYPREAFVNNENKKILNLDRTNSILSDLDICEYKGCDREGSSFSNCRWMGVDVDKSLQNFSDRTCEIQSEVYEIRKCFQEEDLRINRLIKEAIKLRRDIRETKYLDELLHLLNGKVEKLKSKQWPFRLGSRKTCTETNLII